MADVIQIDPYRSQRKTDPNALTKRELQVRDMILLGKSNREIADEFKITIKCVKSHITNFYKKLNIKTRYQLIATYGPVTA